MSQHKAHKLRDYRVNMCLYLKAITCKDHKEFGKIKNVF